MDNKNKRYLYSRELLDLYRVLYFYISNGMNSNSKYAAQDMKLFSMTVDYFSDNTDSNSVYYINSIIDNGGILLFLKKIIGSKIVNNLEKYIDMCGNDMHEFKRDRALDDKFEMDDAYDLYLYYYSRNLNSSIIKKRVNI